MTKVKWDQPIERRCRLRSWSIWTMEGDTRSTNWKPANKGFEGVSYCLFKILRPLQKTYSWRLYLSLCSYSRSLYIPISCKLLNRILFKLMDVDSHIQDQYLYVDVVTLGLYKQEWKKMRFYIYNISIYNKKSRWKNSEVGDKVRESWKKK